MSSQMRGVTASLQLPLGVTGREACTEKVQAHFGALQAKRLRRGTYAA